MARHKVGNSYLSDEEYEANTSTNWKIGSFLVVGILVGFFSMTLTENIDVKLLRFSIIIGAGLISGYIAAKLSEIIRWLVVLSIILGIIYFIGMWIWNSL